MEFAFVRVVLTVAPFAPAATVAATSLSPLASTIRYVPPPAVEQD